MNHCEKLGKAWPENVSGIAVVIVALLYDIQEWCTLFCFTFIGCNSKRRERFSLEKLHVNFYN